MTLSFVRTDAAGSGPFHDEFEFALDFILDGLRRLRQ
jgi:hypothetical protein